MRSINKVKRVQKKKMTSRVIGVYSNDLDELITDLFKHEKIIKKWKSNHKDYHIELKIEIDKNNFYTLLLECKKQ